MGLFSDTAVQLSDTVLNKASDTSKNGTNGDNRQCTRIIEPDDLMDPTIEHPTRLFYQFHWHLAMAPDVDEGTLGAFEQITHNAFRLVNKARSARTIRLRLYRGRGGDTGARRHALTRPR